MGVQTKSVLTVAARFRAVVVKSDSGTNRRRTKASADRSIGCEPLSFASAPLSFLVQPAPTVSRRPRCGRVLSLVSRAEPDQPGVDYDGGRRPPPPPTSFPSWDRFHRNLSPLWLHLMRIKRKLRNGYLREGGGIKIRLANLTRSI